MLGELLAPLDYPRQALANLGRGLYRGLSGEGTWQDALGAAPGALGVLGGSLLGGPLGGVLGGSLIGGAAQGLGKLSGADAFQAPEGNAILRELGGDQEDPLQSLAAGLATDPLTYAGLGGGARLARGVKQGLAAEDFSSLLKGGEHALPPGALGALPREVDPARAFERGMVDMMGRPYSHLPSAPRQPAAPPVPLPQGEPSLEALHAAIEAQAGEQAARDAQIASRAGLEAQDAQRQARQADVVQARRGQPGPPQGIPVTATPQEYAEELGRRYGLLSDFEHDVRGMSQGPEVIGQRAGIWHDILGAEMGYDVRRDMHFWEPPGLTAQEYRDWSSNAAFPPGSLPRQWSRRGGNAPQRHPITGAQADSIAQRALSLELEQEILPHIPGTTEELARMLGNNRVGANDVRFGHGVPGGAPYVGRGASLGELAGRVDPDVLRQAHIQRALHGGGRHIENLIHGRGESPGAEEAVRRILGMGYPIDPESVLHAWQTGGLAPRLV